MIDYAAWYKRILKLYSFLPYSLFKGYAFPPLTVQMEVTHRCNLNCSFCFLEKSANSSLELTYEEIKEIIDQIPPWSLLTFTGGEPFVRKDFFKILQYALDKGKCNVVTNADLITDEFIDLFLSKNLLLMGISLDGVGKIHDKLRGKNGLFDVVIDAIKRIQIAKKKQGKRYPLIDIKTVILEQNLTCLFKILELADKLKVDFFTVSLPKLSDIQFTPPYYDEFRQNKFFSPPYKKGINKSVNLKILKEELDLIREYSGSVSVRFYPYNMLNDYAIRQYYNGELKISDFYPCFVPWTTVCISPYGDMYPCLAYRIGNLREHRFKELWNSQRFRTFRQSLRKAGILPSCLGCCYSEFKSEVIPE